MIPSSKYSDLLCALQAPNFEVYSLLETQKDIATPYHIVRNMALQSVANVISNQAIKGLRMATVKYGPVAGAATDAFLRAADASRQFKRDAAIASEDPLTEEEYRHLEEACTDLTESAVPRTVSVGYQMIRSSREGFKTTGINSPIPLFSHWFLQVSSALLLNDSLFSSITDWATSVDWRNILRASRAYTEQGFRYKEVSKQKSDLSGAGAGIS